MELADLVVTAVLTVAGLWLAHDLRRQQRLKVAEHRVAAYRDLWALMETARASRGDGTDPHGAGALTRGEALTLFDAMTKWYFGEGRGMLLTNETKELYLEAKSRLGAYGASPGGDVDADAGTRRIRELSLLRTQMKYDVGIYGVFYFHELTADDREFLAARKIDPDPWAARFVPWPARLRRRLPARFRARADSEAPTAPAQTA